jgi:hypothetical protein
LLALVAFKIGLSVGYVLCYGHKRTFMALLPQVFTEMVALLYSYSRYFRRYLLQQTRNVYVFLGDRQIIGVPNMFM